MDARQNGDEEEVSKKPPIRPVIPTTPRKEQPSPIKNSGQGLRLTPFSTEAVWDRRNRIMPKAPKIPFSPSGGGFGVAGTGTKVPVPEKHHGRRRIFAFFRSRRKGRSRVINFILLPLAILLTAAALIYILKFL